MATNAKALAGLGHDVAVSAFFGLNGAILEWEGARIYPGGYHAYGNDVLLNHARHHMGGDLANGLIITLIDVWVLDPAILSQANVACIVPIDHEPAPEAVLKVLRESGAVPIAMSRHGQRMLTDAGLDALYVPHAIDTDLYSPGDRTEARDALGLPYEAFIVGMVAANKGTPPRKGWPQAIEAFAAFQRAHPDAILYMHTEPHGIVQGVNIPAILAANNVPVEAVRFGESQAALLGAPHTRMRDLYRAFNVLLNPSYVEGFGITVIAAQSCSIPVIVTDWTAMTEVGEVGWHVGGQRVWTDQGSYMKTPDIEQLTRALESAYDMADRMAGPAREHALKYDTKRVATEYWVPAIDAIIDRLGIGRPARMPVPTELVPA